MSPSNLPCFMLDHYSESCQTRIHDTIALPCFNINFTGASPVWKGGTRPSTKKWNTASSTHCCDNTSCNFVRHQYHTLTAYFTRNTIYTVFNTRHYCSLASCVRPAHVDTCSATRLPCGFHHCCNMAEMLPGPAGIFALSSHKHFTKGTSGRCSLVLSPM